MSILNTSETFNFTFEGKFIPSICAGIILFFLTYIFLNQPLQEELRLRPLNSQIWFFSKLIAFISVVLHLLISSALGKKTANKGYEFEIKYVFIRPFLFLISTSMFVSIGCMFGVFILLLVSK